MKLRRKASRDPFYFGRAPRRYGRAVENIAVVTVLLLVLGVIVKACIG